MPIKRDIPRTKENLVKAQQVLQNAHDYIEVCGFDINTELENKQILTQEVLEEIREGKIRKFATGAACFIGSARLGAGVVPSDFYQLGTDGGDGPELSIALELMDEAVPEDYREAAEESDERSSDGEESYEIYNDSEGDDWGPGGVAEAYGFIIRRTEGYDGKGEATAESAIQLYKTALRNVYTLIENSEN